jgi:hypothetical protein
MAAIAQSVPQGAISGVESKVRQKKSYEYWAPTAKVSVGALAGAATILLAAFLGPHWKAWTQQDMTPAIGAAITNILTFAIQYMVPDRRR